jgi:DNA polymerase
MSKSRNSWLRRAARQQLESLRDAGVLELPQPSPTVQRALGQASAEVERNEPNAPASAARAETTPSPNVGAPVAPATAIESTGRAARSLLLEDGPMGEEISTAATLDVLQQEVAECTRCHELAATRTQTVFGVGDPQARLCFLGEAPGADEDRRGEPFVGRAGQLLNKILEACGLRREEVYILNVLKCRPPGNRNPAPEESLNCRRFLDRQLQLIDPEFICCLGAVAAQNLLATTAPIGKLRGTVHQYRGINVVCTYHPAYLLRNPSAKKNTWDDMKLLMRELGSPVD